MEYKPDSPLIGIISRITEQKGFDLLLDAMDELMKMNIQICILGDGDPKLVEALAAKQKKYPGKFSLNVTFDDKMAHLIEAGSDLYLMPSKYEPCGLNQIYSLRYATIPIVSNVGGLVDTVEEIDTESGEGTGFIIDDLSGEGIVAAVKQAVHFLKESDKLEEVQKRIME
jgi:starch synthase